MVSVGSGWGAGPRGRGVRGRRDAPGGARRDLGHRRRALRPFETRLLFRGGALDVTWAARHPPQRFRVPADTRRAELHALITGHGSQTSQCAEFCNHGHPFRFNGHDHVVDFPEAR